MVNFYDKVLTNESTNEGTKESINVTCCKNHPNSDDVIGITVSCGLGKSCASQCTEQLSHLCPTGNCTGDFEDCIPSYQAEEESGRMEEGEMGSRSRPGRGGGGSAQLIFPRGFLVGVQIDVD